MSAQQQVAQDILQQLIDAFNQNVYSPFLLGSVMFMGLLWFFHEFREWRLSIAVLTSLILAAALTLAVSPSSPVNTLLGGP